MNRFVGAEKMLGIGGGNIVSEESKRKYVARFSQVHDINRVLALTHYNRKLVWILQMTWLGANLWLQLHLLVHH